MEQSRHRRSLDGACSKNINLGCYRVIVRTADFFTPPWDALIVANIFRLTLTVLILKLADALPEGIVTVAGTFARFGWLLDNFTTKPAEGAGAVSDTVPADAAPPATVVGLRVNEARIAGADTGDGNKLIDADFVTLL